MTDMIVYRHIFWPIYPSFCAAPFRPSENMRPVILTGEWLPKDLLLSRTPAGWRLAAVIDFGGVMTLL
ncbi:hypothetical protein [Paracoccus alkanivorans]|uniref:Uncharacterized protein n=1 Tax=Paracoccus alkanivorans TaxID=2116655 RepID=A0A3M0M5Y6_9RHOB|nr:hypothetical protein [Paracoccus alkanivorans]RMC33192.1 hypothetical protein C9E81_16760 [Paracoccus alkanivorans]